MISDEALSRYIDGELDLDEAMRIEAALEADANLRARLDGMLATDRNLKSAFDALLDRPAPAHLVAAARAPAAAPSRRSGPKAWVALAIAAQAVVVIVAGVVLREENPARPSAAGYHALSSGPSAPGNILIVFKADARASDFGRALASVEARIVDGPNAANAYVLSVPRQQRDTAVAALRALPSVALVQPVGEVAR